MKKLLILLVFTQIIAVVSAQISFTVNVAEPFGLSSAITEAGGNLNTITNLTVTGTIDASDFKTMRDKMPALTVVDLTRVSIAAYKGEGGTADAGSLGNPFKMEAIGGLLDGTATDRYPAKAIPKNAFANHSTTEKISRFTSITLPSTVTSIGGNAFYRCNSLTSITIPAKVTSINTNAFYGCTGLASVTFSGQVTNIGVNAFSGCSGLTSITIPGSLISIGNGAFSGTNVVFTVDKSNTKFSSVDGVLFDKTQTKLMQCPISKKGNYSIPNTVTSIAVGAFENCKDLSELTIPNSVTLIGYSAFNGCSGLTSVTIPNSVTTIQDRAFYGCSGLTTLIIPNSVNSISDCAFQDCSSLTSVTIPNSLSSIRQNVFADCIGLTTVTIPGSVTTIGMDAFARCKGLTSVTIPPSVISIGRYAFYECTGLKTITISSSLSDIGPYAFHGCNAMFSVDPGNTNYSSVDGALFDKTQTTLLRCPISKNGSYSIPGTVTSIGDGAFNDCSAIFSVDAGNADYSSVDGVLFNKKQTKLIRCPTSKNGNYSIPNTVTSIEDGAFGECSRLTTVVIHNKVNSIGGGSFSGCSAIISVDKENSNYSGLEGVLFDKNQTVLMHCPITRTGSYSIPNTVTIISDFEKCIGLTSIIIPESVTTIGVSCFNFCSGLTSIKVKSSQPVALSTFASVFYKIDKKSCKLYVPIGSKSLYQDANQWKDFENIIEVSSSKAL
jgi:hypothetical protein